jgi:SAM-dependent methyltransferase
MIDPNEVMEHYGTASLVERIGDALRQAGLEDRRIEWTDLTPLDQFHIRGLGATKELAAALSLNSDSTVLDVGCGLGGPARFLAATYGCRVTGIDLSEPFVDAARMLTERAGLSHRISFVQANALDLPFADGSFEVGWTQHVAMNIADRATFYASIHRVLKPGGRLAIYDVLAGDAGPPIYPLPWARTAEVSFLLTPDAMRSALANAGFEEVSWDDKTDAARAWAAEMQAKRQPPPALLGIQVVMGPEFSEMAANIGRSIEEGRVRVVQAVVAKGRAGVASAPT